MGSFKRFLDKKTPTVEQVAAKHKKSVDFIKKQLEAGIKVEQEHSTSKLVAKEIALDHLNERPDYYIRLKKVE